MNKSILAPIFKAILLINLLGSEIDDLDGRYFIIDTTVLDGGTF